MSANPPFDMVQIQNDYEEHKTGLNKFQVAIGNRIESCLSSEKLELAVPLETRIKTLPSVIQKIQSGRGRSLLDLPDLVGFRLIVGFQSELETVASLIEKTFTATKRDDKASKLGNNQFGYQSYHYDVQLSGMWKIDPLDSGTTTYRAEIQVRTLAQHIWAFASHKLQYKRATDPPSSMLRSINRVSAILELVDLEFQRVLEEKDKYLLQVININELLNVISLEKMLKKSFPNDDSVLSSEDYSDLLADLTYFNIDTAKKLEDLIEKHHSLATQIPDFLSNSNVQWWGSQSGPNKVGIVRLMLSTEFGEAYKNYQDKLDID